MLVTEGYTGLVLNFPKHLQFTDDEFFDFCQQNPELKFERDENENILIMALTGGKTGNRNTKIVSRLDIWAEKSNTGLVFDSSTGFKMPVTGAVRSPDAAWVSFKQWNQLTEIQKEKHPPVCPEFIVELMSDSDSLEEALDKMQKYLQNGCLLAWLIVPQLQKVFIYRTKGEVSEVKGFQQKLSGEDVLQGFEFDLSILK